MSRVDICISVYGVGRALSGGREKVCCAVCDVVVCGVW